jgi:AcrR family transcriptional regulator
LTAAVRDGGSRSARQAADKQQAERDAILRVAYRLIGRGPDSTASVQEILDGAELSTRAFYRHFRSKDELILTMYRTAADRVAVELSDVAAAAGGAPAALEAWIHHQLAVVYDGRRARQTAVLNSVEVRATAGFDQVHQASDTVRRTILAEVLRQGRRDGSLPGVVDPDEDARAVVSVVGGIVMAKLAGDRAPSWSAASRHTADLFLRAFGHQL